MRQLVTIRTINQLTPIEGADSIEAARVDGWTAVVKKGEFAVGDRCVYFEIDSFIDTSDPRFASFDSKAINWQGNRGMRVRTIRLRGQLSQGLVLPLDEFPELSSAAENEDLSAILNVKKWEPVIPPCLAGDVVGPFPSFIPITDEERVQNIPDIFETDAQVMYDAAIKMDGTSSTFFLNKGEFGVCGRRWQLKESPDSTYWRMAKRYKLEELLRRFDGRNLAIQGEIVGPGIQNNRENFPEHTLYIFRLFDIDTQQYIEPLEAKLMLHRASISLDVQLNFVKTIARGNLSAFGKSIDDLLKFAEGPGIKCDVREGLVWTKSFGSKKSFKTISNEWLEKFKQ